MTIPVFINTFNRLTTTRDLADQVAKLPGARPIIIDNNSDYQPLLDWYSSCDYEVIQLRENVGHHAPWLRVIPPARQFAREYGASKYVVSDCDLCIKDCPLDVLEALEDPFHWRQNIVKSGLSLRIDDLPDWQSAVREWEMKFWSKRLRSGRYYDAPIDTTFAMYDSATPHSLAMSIANVHSVRSAPPYTARHLPWYVDGDSLDEENQHYFRTANASNSWKPQGRKMVASYAS